MWGPSGWYDIGRADDRPSTILIRPSDAPLRITARVSASGPLARPSELTSALSRLVRGTSRARTQVRKPLIRYTKKRL
jgi:hypothetical protein